MPMPGQAPSPRRVFLAGLLALLAARPALAAERDEEEGKPPPVPGAPVFVNMPPITLPVIEGDKVTRQVGALLTLELVKGQAAATVLPRRRELTDAFITELYRIYGWRSGANRVVSDELVKRHLLAAADRVLGKGVVRAVLVRQLVEQNQ